MLLSWTLKLPQDYLLCKQTAVARDTAMQAHSDWITTYIIRLPRRRPWGARGRVQQHMHIHTHTNPFACTYACLLSKNPVSQEYLQTGQTPLRRGVITYGMYMLCILLFCWIQTFSCDTDNAVKCILCFCNYAKSVIKHSEDSIYWMFQSNKDTLDLTYWKIVKALSQRRIMSHLVNNVLQQHTLRLSHG